MLALPCLLVLKPDVTKLNAAISSNSELQGKSLDDIMATASGGVFNNAAQVLSTASTPASTPLVFGTYIPFSCLSQSRGFACLSVFDVVKLEGVRFVFRPPFIATN